MSRNIVMPRYVMDIPVYIECSSLAQKLLLLKYEFYIEKHIALILKVAMWTFAKIKN